MADQGEKSPPRRGRTTTNGPREIDLADIVGPNIRSTRRYWFGAAETDLDAYNAHLSMAPQLENIRGKLYIYFLLSIYGCVYSYARVQRSVQRSSGRGWEGVHACLAIVGVPAEWGWDTFYSTPPFPPSLCPPHLFARQPTYPASKWYCMNGGRHRYDRRGHHHHQ